MPYPISGSAQPSGALAGVVTRDLGDLRASSGVPRAPLRWRVLNFLRYGWRGWPAVLGMRILGALLGAVWIETALRLRVLHADGSITDFGVVSRRLVTTAGVNYLVDALQGTVEPENLKYHGFGTGTTAEAAGDTALVTELTTQYAGDVRPTGTTTEGASANIYRTVATLSPDAGGTIAVTEHGIFSAVSAGTLLDRSVFAAINLVAASDSLQATYELTLSSGG